MKIFLWVIGIFVLAVIGIALFSGGSAGGTNYSLSTIEPTDHVKGTASSTVVLIEYADFQCPACRSYYPIMRQVVEAYGNRIAVVYRHFPLTGIHVNAEVAARAAEAAGKQGKFWEMHDLLFEKQGEWETSSEPLALFEKYAELLTLDKAQFLADISSREVKDIVSSQRANAIKNGFNSTPTFVLGGKKIENPQSLEAFRLVLNNALK